MTTYRPLVGWTHLVLGALALLPALILPLVFGGIWGIVAVGSKDPEASAIVGVTFGVVLIIVLAVLLVSGGLSIAAGVGVLRGKAWGDLLAIVASLLHVLNFPIGTIVGAFTLWVLLAREPASRLGTPRADTLPVGS